MPPEQVNTPAPVQSEVAKSVSFWGPKMIWISLAVIVLLGVGAYFVTHQQSSSNMSWETFRAPDSSTYAGLQINYPASWNAGQNASDIHIPPQEGEGLVALSFANYSNAYLEAQSNTSGSYLPADYQDVNVTIVYSELSLDQYIKKNYPGATSASLPDGSILLQSSQTLDGGATKPSVRVLVKRGTYIYNFETITGSNNKDLKSIIREMIASLVPIENTDSSGTANWKTYHNDGFGFSISYPKDITPEVISASDDYLEIHFGSYTSITVWKKPDPSSNDLFTGPYPKTVTSTISSDTLAERTLNGLKGVESYGGGSEGHSYSDVFLYRDKYLWSIALDPIIEGRITTKDWYAENPPPANDAAIYKKMLASFKVDPSVTNQPTNTASVFSVSPTSGKAPLSVTTKSFDVCQFNTIDWGDGASFNSGNAMHTCEVQGHVFDVAEHTYHSAGTYTATLKNPSGGTMGTSKIIVSGSGLQSVGGLDSYGTPVSKYTIDGMHAYYDGKIIDADAETLEILKGSLQPMKDYISYPYARDTKSVYYDGKLLVGVKPNTFQPIENGQGTHHYGTDGQTVYFGSGPLPGANPKTFKILWQTIYEGCGKTHYSKDAAHVYFDATVITGADVATFESLINGYGKDKNGYFKGTVYIGSTFDQKELVCNYG